MPIVIIMGATGAGKTTIGRLLADRLGCTFQDADAFHPPSNVAKMRAGVPLTDEDRWPWLDALQRLIRDASERRAAMVLACSALKQSYRDRMTQGVAGVRWVYLKADAALLRTRVEARRDHFMPADLVESQLADLEEPQGAIVVDAAEPPERAADIIWRALRERSWQ